MNCSSSRLSISCWQELTWQPLRCLHKPQHVPCKDQSPPALQETKGGLDKCNLPLKREQPRRICCWERNNQTHRSWGSDLRGLAPCGAAHKQKKRDVQDQIHSIPQLFAVSRGTVKAGTTQNLAMLEEGVSWETLGEVSLFWDRHLEPSRTNLGVRAVVALLGSPPLVGTCRFTPKSCFNSSSPPARMS